MLTQEQTEALEFMAARIAAESNDYVLSVYTRLGHAPYAPGHTPADIPLFEAVAALAERRLADIRHNAVNRCW
jgi:hypothetical protein